ncbi:TetR/AcrR family transcriptional regulator [Aestuariirhabdus litorea]|uniref:TetR family transcriptional regulator n=1 Tax=Aestuariirhabdus litorea TaxID=2528527 RepID=A0A3P3VR03_9GAMM|nr:TetR family transcriptional regulator [Aestuariirhabdus litorea]RRJ85221.1 TetR family transcriptional regulator [Aestuariirhabdus litorea]RWW98442.1 TetR family transcriptional regulator [Endozoicomonadaceae bacterium GTF-13]
MPEDKKSLNRPDGRQPIKYRGRKARRSGSEQRRRTILEAALRVAIREGVRGIRHRAVAREANVPLSATTYYFKDINDLIIDTFTLFVEQTISEVNRFWVESGEQIEQLYSQLDDALDSRRIFAANMTDLAQAFVALQVNSQRERLLAEQALHQEALRSASLRDLVLGYRHDLLAELVGFYQRLGTSDPELDASLTNAVLIDCEYQCLLHGDDWEQQVPVRAILHRHFLQTLGLVD